MIDNRLVLGCAQLGMNYGIANTTGKPTIQEAVKIVATAWQNGITHFDTASDYGDSMNVLGACFKYLKIKPNVVTKFKNTEDIDLRVDYVLEVLGVDKLHGLLLHDESQLWTYETMKIIEDRVDNIGVSVYDLKRAELPNRVGMMVQLPFNLFDQRLLDHNFSGKNLFIRSIYLQGVLSYESIRGVAMAFVVQKAPKHSKFIVGVETVEQLVDNIKLYKGAADHKLDKDMSWLSTTDQKIINPSLWKKETK